MSANPQPEPDRLEVAADEAVAACGGNARDAVKALLIASEFLEAQISQGYLRGVRHGRFNIYSGYSPLLDALLDPSANNFSSLDYRTQGHAIITRH